MFRVTRKAAKSTMVYRLFSVFLVMIMVCTSLPPLVASVAAQGTITVDDLDGDSIPNATDPETIVDDDFALPAGEYVFQDLRITNRAVLTLESDLSLPGFKGGSLTAKSITVDAYSYISADGMGYGPSEGPGAGDDYLEPGKGGAGAGYGGNGASVGNSKGGTSYGSMTNPGDLGSGGGNGDNAKLGGSGGGAIQIHATKLTVNGEITASGVEGDYDVDGGGGGSGGSIYINTGTLNGKGVVAAHGGGGGSVGGCGGGGGGRIVIEYINKDFSDKFRAHGGNMNGDQDGGAGTVLLKSSSQAKGSLFINNWNVTGAETPLENNIDLDELIVLKKATPRVDEQAIVDVGTISVARFSTLTNDGTIKYETTDHDDGLIENFGVFDSGEIKLEEITLVNHGTLLAGNNSLTIGQDGILIQDSGIDNKLVLDNLTIENRGVLTCQPEKNLILILPIPW